MADAKTYLSSKMKNKLAMAVAMVAVVVVAMAVVAMVEVVEVDSGEDLMEIQEATAMETVMAEAMEEEVDHMEIQILIVLDLMIVIVDQAIKVVVVAGVDLIIDKLIQELFSLET